MPLDVSHLPASLHPYLWGGTAAMVAEASTFPIGELTPKVSSPIHHFLPKSCLLSPLSPCLTPRQTRPRRGSSCRGARPTPGSSRLGEGDRGDSGDQGYGGMRRVMV